MALLQTDFQQQGINALNTGMGIGNAMQRTRQLGIDRQRQADIDAQRNQMFQQKQGIMGQQSQMNQQAIEQQEQTKGMGELITALNLPFDKRNELFAELEASRTSPDSKKYLAHLQTLGDEEQLTSMIQLLNSRGGQKETKDTRTSGIKDFQYYTELKKTDPEAAMQFGIANKILSGDGEVIMKTGDVNTINNGVSKLTAEYKGVRSAAKDLDRLGKLKSAPAQMAMIFKFMKALDPASTVRESEYASAANTTGIPERIMNMYNKAKDGQMLNDVQVNEFINVSKTLANAKGEDVRATVGDYLNTYDITDARRSRFMKTARVNPFEIAPARVAAKEPVTPVISSQYTEGQTATGANGAKIIFTNGQWVNQ